MMISAFYRSTLIVAMMTSLASTTLASEASPRGLKKGNNGNRGRGNGRERMTLYARTTLLNLDIEEMTDEEIMYFESAFARVFNDLQETADEADDKDNGHPRLRSFVVEDVVKNAGRGKGKHRGLLRGGEIEASESTTGNTEWPEHGRSLFNFYETTAYFDIFAFLEATSCSFCGPADDDGFRGRQLSAADDEAAHRLLETTLLDELRSGPFPDFAELEDCRIVYMSA